MLYREIYKDKTLEYEGTPEEINDMLYMREDNPIEINIVGGVDYGSPEGDMTSTVKLMKTQRILDIKDASTKELVEELSKRTEVKVERVKGHARCNLNIRHRKNPMMSKEINIEGPATLLRIQEIY